jgi:hypothetical protein
MKKKAIVICSLVIILAILVAYAIHLGNTPMSEHERAQMIREIEDEMECGGFGNTRTCKIPIFTNPIFRMVQVCTIGENEGYEFKNFYYTFELTPVRIDVMRTIQEEVYKNKEREIGL